MIGSPDDALAMWQFVRHVGESILVAGLLVDLFVIVFLHDGKKLEKRGSIFGTAVIIIGVIVENLAGGYGDEIVRQMRAPRNLTSYAQAALSGELKAFRGQHFLMETYLDDPECVNLSARLENALQSAGWIPEPAEPISKLAARVGIIVTVQWGLGEGPDKAANALVEALRHAKLSTSDLWHVPLGWTMQHSKTAHGNTIEITIGRKP